VLSVCRCLHPRGWASRTRSFAHQPSGADQTARDDPTPSFWLSCIPSHQAPRLARSTVAAFVAAPGPGWHWR
jgi:hypothetical protein